MADEARIPVSESDRVQFVFEVSRVDNRLLLFPEGQENAGRDFPPPGRFPLRRDTPYVVLYENNDGGPGVFEFAIYETLDRQDPEAPRKLRRRVGPRHFDGPAVVKYAFRLVADPGRIPPEGS